VSVHSSVFRGQSPEPMVQVTRFGSQRINVVPVQLPGIQNHFEVFCRVVGFNSCAFSLESMLIFHSGLSPPLTDLSWVFFVRSGARHHGSPTLCPLWPPSIESALTGTLVDSPCLTSLYNLLYLS